MEIETNQGMKYGYIDKNENQIISLDQELLYRVTEINSEDAYLVASQMVDWLYSKIKLT